MKPIGWMKTQQRVRQQLSGGFPGFMAHCALPLSLAGLLILSTGCASRSAMIIAQRHTTEFLGTTDKITLASQGQPRQEEQELRRVLVAELEREGFDIVDSKQADYTLGYWLDESWNVGPDASRFAPRYYLPPQRTIVYGPGGSVDYYGEADSLPVRIPNSRDKPERMYLPTKGIRLRLYPNHGSVSERLSPVWEGYIELGLNTSPEHESVMIKTLLAHFGQDFKGRVRLKK